MKALSSNISTELITEQLGKAIITNELRKGPCLVNCSFEKYRMFQLIEDGVFGSVLA